MAQPNSSPNSSQDPDNGSTVRQIAIAMELPFMIVAPVVLGGAVGFFLDRWLHTKPILMIVLGLAGVVMGIYDALKTASASDKPLGK
jgi:ATP synthase protein I